ncbi:hypothetical protein [Marivita sp.]|uniref:hypothetical protein n=1 Tax=Marivita sp. TaxID=2003365 RepID=UPI00261A4A18|nr:hypothetical protein [Marivita sp.]
MTLFLAYDPSEKGKNGVAAIQVVSNVPKVAETATVRDAAKAMSWPSVPISVRQLTG